MTSMTTARAAAPNLGGRANTRSRAAVANFGASNVLDFAASSESTAVGAAYWPARCTVAPTENSANRPINDTPALKARPARGTGPRSLRVRFGHSWYALPAPAGSAQPIAHHGVLSVDSQPLAFTPAIRHAGALCLTRGFLFAHVAQLVESTSTVDALSGRTLTVTCECAGSSPAMGATFTAPPRTTTLATGNYGNGWRTFNAAFLAEPNPQSRTHATKHGQQTDAANACASREKFARVVGYAQAIPARNSAPNYRRSRRACGGPLPARAGLSFSDVSSTHDQLTRPPLRNPHQRRA